MDEDKQLICDRLLPALQATWGGSKLVNLVYAVEPAKETVMAEFQGGWKSGRETVTAVFEGGWKKVADVTCDSGTALIYDVMRQIF